MIRKAATTALVLALVFASTAGGTQRIYDTDILADTFGFDSGSETAVDLNDLQQGCPARDCIPSIDAPKFVSAEAADHVDADDVVLAVSHGGEHRAYPARILDQHEIVNDTIGGTPVAITYCPLCGSAVGVKRRIGDTVTEFGVSGLLYNSDLVFYDRKTNTLWDQIEAKGIVGPLTGRQLELVPVSIVRWSRWKTAHPDTLVLSEETGFEGRDYSRDHYARYRASEELMFPVSAESDAIRPKTPVYGFDTADYAIAFVQSLLEDEGSYSHDLDERTLTLTRANDGSVTMTDSETGETHAPTPLFWFAWYTFHPDTKLVR